MIENDHESIQKSLRQSNEQDTFIYVHHIDKTVVKGPKFIKWCSIHAEFCTVVSFVKLVELIECDTV